MYFQAQGLFNTAGKARPRQLQRNASVSSTSLQVRQKRHLAPRKFSAECQLVLKAQESRSAPCTLQTAQPCRDRLEESILFRSWARPAPASGRLRTEMATRYTVQTRTSKPSEQENGNTCTSNYDTIQGDALLVAGGHPSCMRCVVRATATVTARLTCAAESLQSPTGQ